MHRAGGGSRPDDTGDWDGEPEATENAAAQETEEEGPREGSLRLSWRDGHGSHFAAIEQGAFHAGGLSAEEGPSADEMKYVDGVKILHDGKEVCEIVRRLGQGAMGTVYLGKLPAGGGQCAVKVVREDTSTAKRMEYEQQFTAEVSISFAMGRHALIASVVGVIVPLPGVVTTAKGMLLLSDLVDGGDLEEAMSTKEAVRMEKPDYKGKLWDTESARTWPLETITLQIFLGFAHVHSRGVIHQVTVKLSNYWSYLLMNGSLSRST